MKLHVVMLLTALLAVFTATNLLAETPDDARPAASDAQIYARGWVKRGDLKMPIHDALAVWKPNAVSAFGGPEPRLSITVLPFDMPADDRKLAAEGNFNVWRYTRDAERNPDEKVWEIAPQASFEFVFTKERDLEKLQADSFNAIGFTLWFKKVPYNYLPDKPSDIVQSLKCETGEEGDFVTLKSKGEEGALAWSVEVRTPLYQPGKAAAEASGN